MCYIQYMDTNQLYHCPHCPTHEHAGKGMEGDSWSSFQDSVPLECPDEDAEPAAAAAAAAAVGGASAGGRTSRRGRTQCDKERRAIYEELFIGYMDYARQRGFRRSLIWAMPPARTSGVMDDYMFHYRCVTGPRGPPGSAQPTRARRTARQRQRTADSARRTADSKTDLIAL